MPLYGADYAILCVTAVLAILGLFRGLSGVMAFIAAGAVSSLATTLSWRHSVAFTDVLWHRVLAVVIIAVIAFGLVRLLVRKLVGGLLAQPSDSIFGFIIGAIAGLSLFVIWAIVGYGLEYSAIASLVAHYVG